jgi:hypothetical protein
MDSGDRVEPPKSSVDETFDRLFKLLSELPEDSQEKFRELLNSESNEGRRKSNKRHLKVVDRKKHRE